MNNPETFRCPACGFTIFNRRLAKCEQCAAVVPEDLRFSPDEISRIEADHETNTLIRAKIAREEAEQQALRAKLRRMGTTNGAIRRPNR